MINTTDEIIFDYYSRKGRHTFEPMEKTDAYDIAHYLYRGRTIGTVSERVQKILDIPNVQFLGMACKGSIQRSIEAASILSTSIPQEEGDEDIDNARLNNALNSTGLQDQLDTMLRSQDFADELVEGQDDLHGIVAGHGTEFKSSAKDDLRHLIMRNTAKTKDILSAYGAMKELIGKAKRTKIFPSQTVIKDVKLGDDLSKLLTDELIVLALPELQHLANLRFVNKELLQFHLEEEKPTGKGPLVIYIDTSSSMEQRDVTIDGNAVNRLAAAAGVCLALVNELIDQGREFKVVGFNEDVRTFGDDKDPNMCKIRLMTAYPDSGTSIGAVLNHMKHVPKDWDALILSDAEFETKVKIPESEARRGLIEFGTSSGFDTSQFDMAIKIKTIEDFDALTDFAV